jgi:hypothetical protein
MKPEIPLMNSVCRHSGSTDSYIQEYRVDLRIVYFDLH